MNTIQLYIVGDRVKPTIQTIYTPSGRSYLYNNPNTLLKVYNFETKQFEEKKLDVDDHRIIDTFIDDVRFIKKHFGEAIKEKSELTKDELSTFEKIRAKPLIKSTTKAGETNV